MGLLVVANNDAINSWVAKQGNGKKWIGATDLKSEGTWLWSDGSRVSAESWTHWTGEGPDNADTALPSIAMPNGTTTTARRRIHLYASLLRLANKVASLKAN